MIHHQNGQSRGILSRTFASTLLTAALVPRVAPAQHLEVPVHDPVMAREGETFYLFHTGRGVSAWTSTDLVNWERLQAVYDSAPAWTESIVPGFSDRNHMWAPDVIHRGGRYFLYYSVSAFGRNTSGIGVATNTTLNPANPDYRWIDHGVVVQSIPGRDLWNALTRM